MPLHTGSSGMMCKMKSLCSVYQSLCLWCGLLQKCPGFEFGPFVVEFSVGLARLAAWSTTVQTEITKKPDGLP